MSWSEQRNAKHLSLIALGLLVIQNTSLVLLMRVSLTKSGPQYLTSTAVAMMEVSGVALSCNLSTSHELGVLLTRDSREG